MTQLEKDENELVFLEANLIKIQNRVADRIAKIQGKIGNKKSEIAEKKLSKK